MAWKVHRVAPIAIDRYSLVFLLRARPDAILDCAALRSPMVLDAGEEELKQTITVAQFMKGFCPNKKRAFVFFSFFLFRQISEQTLGEFFRGRARTSVEKLCWNGIERERS